jgi:hypothetical protein
MAGSTRRRAADLARRSRLDAVALVDQVGHLRREHV